MDLLRFKESLKFAVKNGRKSIFDDKNKIWRKLQPEELVRQCLYQYFIQVKEVPAHMLNIEHSLSYIDHQYRADLTIMNKTGKVQLVAECKSFHLDLQQKHADQLALYNQKIQAPYLLLTNGKETLVFHRDNLNKFLHLNDLPDYKELKQL